MPELPEVETTRRGIRPHICGRSVERVVVRNSALRWPVPGHLPLLLVGEQVLDVERRAKYLLIRVGAGTLVIHLGMSGSLRVVEEGVEHGRHDHVDLLFSGGVCLRYNDPRRFGSILWYAKGEESALLKRLGPEPLGGQFDAAYFYSVCQGRRQAIKTLLMDARVVVGVGNIYANEALFLAGVDPRRSAGELAEREVFRVVESVKSVLQAAIEQGGTTLKDFVGSDGKPGYFQLQLRVYGREGQVCQRCGGTLCRVVMAQRATCFCPGCQH